MNQAFLNSVYDVLENSDNKLNSYYTGFMLIVILIINTYLDNFVKDNSLNSFGLI
jgi:hypothetical protein